MVVRVLAHRQDQAMSRSRSRAPGNPSLPEKHTPALSTPPEHFFAGETAGTAASEPEMSKAQQPQQKLWLLPPQTIQIGPKSLPEKIAPALSKAGICIAGATTATG